jgi:serine/threonine protein kinase
VYRDFETGNVMLVPNRDEAGGVRAVITDFGLAHSAAAGDAIVTPTYMAPEQLEGAPAAAPRRMAMRWSSIAR